MSHVYAVHQTKQRAPDWLRIEQRSEDCTVTTVPLGDVRGEATSSFGTRIVSGGGFMKSLNERMLREPTSFRVAWDGRQTTVRCVPISGADAVHMETDEAVAILALAPGQQSVAVVDPVSVVAIMAIVTIVAIVALTTTAIVIISEAGDDGGGKSEVEARPNPNEAARQPEETT